MSRTVRLALVMNGGISLAVWMGGVAKELDLAMRASQGGDDQGIADADRPQFERWRDLCRRLDKRIEIDIVAGTSAGGLNGTILATSHAFGSVLPDLKLMWRTSASLSLGALLPPKSHSSSILDGTFFQTALTKVLEGIRTSGGPDAVPSPITLFVTGTALGDHLRSYQDSFSQAFRSPDHRRVYRFRSRPPAGEANEFRAGFDSLGLAARASAGFPVAFAPVQETRPLLGHALGPQDGPAWLIDGGVLDNAPFGPVLDEIVSRPVDTDVQRIVVYVVPSNGGAPVRPRCSDAATSDGQPAWSSVLGSALRFPSEADFRDDLDELTRIFATADAQRGAARLALRTAVDPDLDPAARDALLVGSSTLRPLYRSQQPRYDRAAFVERIQGRTGQAVRLEPLGPDQVVATTPPDDDLGAFGHAAAERMVRNLLADLRDRLAVNDTTPGLDVAVAQVSKALGTLVEQREGIEDDVASRAGTAGGEELTKLVTDALLDGAGARRDAMDSAISAYAGALGDKDDVTRAVVAVEIVTQALAPQVRPAPPPFQLLRLGPDNVSPLAPGAARYGDLKLYGTRLGHFGAFGEQSWRDWDWGWGRLDAAAQLGRALGCPDEQIRELQQGIWDVEGDGKDLDAATAVVGEFTEKDLRTRFGPATVNGLLDSAARMLRAEQPGQSGVLAAIAPRVGAMLQTGWSLNPLWLVPGATIRRKLRAWFR